MKAFLLFLFIGLFIVSCSPTPKPIDFGMDKCDNCKMTIADSKWGAELVTDKGKVYKFDAIECLVSYYLNILPKSSEKLNSMWTINFLQPGELIEVSKSFYLQTSDFHSPMGLNVASFKSISDLNSMNKEKNGNQISWDEVIELVKKGM